MKEIFRVPDRVRHPKQETKEKIVHGLGSVKFPTFAVAAAWALAHDLNPTIAIGALSVIDNTIYEYLKHKWKI